MGDWFILPEQTVPETRHTTGETYIFLQDGEPPRAQSANPKSEQSQALSSSAIVRTADLFERDRSDVDPGSPVGRIEFRCPGVVCPVTRRRGDTEQETPQASVVLLHRCLGQARRRCAKRDIWK